MVNNRSLLTIAAFSSLALNGLILTSMGTSLPMIQAYLRIDLNKAGVLMAFLQAGLTLFSLIAGILTDYFRCERILLSGCMLLCVTSVCFCTTVDFGTNLILVFVMGAGIGCILSGSNSLLVNLYPFRKGTILNIHHVFFGVGSLIGPLLMGYLITKANLWREGLAGQGLILFVLGCFFWFSGGKKPIFQDQPRFFIEVQKLLRDKHFLVILLVNGLSVGVQVTIMMLGVTFLINEKLCTLTVAASTLAAFSLFIIIGRLLCSRLIMTFYHASIVLCLLWFQLAILIMAWYFQGWLAILSLALSGLSFSGIYPTSLALTGILFQKFAGSALGILSTGGGICSMILCWLTGYVASLTDMGNGFIVLILICCATLIIFQIHYRSICQRELKYRTDSPININQ